MIKARPAGARGKTRTDWLDSRHTFSFGNYHDQEHMGFGSLRVINEDRVNPGAGFPTHSHRDMEIITYVLEGAVAHKDSTGNEHDDPAERGAADARWNGYQPQRVQRLARRARALFTNLDRAGRDEFSAGL